ncbi:MAG TPA: flagellar biosynthetic protein FliQ [Candidatus Rubrimentiphilum sp.]|nr:flagellar biosynthetic protein FliQ [Candidatus Rubrimentiphilum sp.]
MEAFDALLHHALVLAALLCLPVLGVATLVGTLVAVAQAATQVQEQTLSLLPKLVAVGVCVALLGAFGMRACEALLLEAIGQMHALVAG